jgi:hypothetical protein
LKDQIVYTLKCNVSRHELDSIRKQIAVESSLWQSSSENAVCVATATHNGSSQLSGVGLLVRNFRHGNIVVAVIDSLPSKKGIGAGIVEELVKYGRNQGIIHFALSYGERSPWLGLNNASAWRRRLGNTVSMVVSLCVLLANPAMAKEVIVGVNTCGIQQMSEQQQDDLINILRKNHITTVRTGIGEKFAYFLTHAYKQGIGAIVIVSLSEGDPERLYRPADKTVGLTWNAPLLSDASISAFSKHFKTQLDLRSRQRDK